MFWPWHLSYKYLIQCSISQIVPYCNYPNPGENRLHMPSISQKWKAWKHLKYFMRRQHLCEFVACGRGLKCRRHASLSLRLEIEMSQLEDLCSISYRPATVFCEITQWLGKKKDCLEEQTHIKAQKYSSLFSATSIKYMDYHGQDSDTFPIIK